MVDKEYTGGANLFLAKNGYIETITATNKYRFKKALDLEYRLAPPYDLRFDDDLDFDLTPNGDVGTWGLDVPLSSTMISETDDFTSGTLSEDDSQALSYWAYELANKRYPNIQFRETLVDMQATAKKALLNFNGILTSFSQEKKEGSGVISIRLDGIIKSHEDFIKSDA